MRPPIWYQIPDPCASFSAFIGHYFESFSLDETLSYCLQMRKSNPREFSKLISSLHATLATCPEKILEAFDALDLIPIAYPEGEAPPLADVVRLFAQVGAFLEGTPVVRDGWEAWSLAKGFCEGLREEFGGRLMI